MTFEENKDILMNVGNQITNKLNSIPFGKHHSRHFSTQKIHVWNDMRVNENDERIFILG